MTKTTSYGWFILSYIAYFISMLGYFISLVPSISTSKLMRRLILTVMYLGLSSQFFGLIYRWKEAGHAPFANMYESLIFFTWVIALVFTLLDNFKPVAKSGAFVLPIICFFLGWALNAIPVSSILSVVNFAIDAITGKGGWFIPPTREADPLMPALNSYWLEVHVITSFLSYAAFAVSSVTAILYLIKHKKTGIHISYTDAESLDKLDEDTYWLCAIGFILLGIGIITGAIWANQTWGSYWSWDPKEVGSLIVWIVYVAYLHARMVAKWRGTKTAWLAIFGFIAVLFCYIGINVILPRFTEAGLHSYGTQ